MPGAHEPGAASVKRATPCLALLWPILAIAYLVASASGDHGIALGIVGLIVGTLIAMTGRRAAGLVTAVALAGACVHWSDSLSFAVYLPPIAGFAFMAFFFQRTLRPGSEPLITRVARREHPDLPQEIERYTRMLTWVWVCCFVFLLSTALLLAPLLPLRSWSRWTQGLAIVLPLILFLGEYAYRHYLLPEHRHAALPTLVHNIIAVIKEEAAIKPAHSSRE